MPKGLFFRLVQGLWIFRTGPATPILKTPVEQVILVLVQCIAQNSERIYLIEEEFRMLRSKVRLLTGKVWELEQGRDIDKLRILHACDHLEETQPHILMQHILMEEMEVGMEILAKKVEMYEARECTSILMINFLYQQVAQLLALLVVYFGFW